MIAGEGGTRVALALRVPLFTAASVGLGVAAHVAGGGAPPEWDLLFVLLVSIAVLWRVLAAGEQSLPRLLAGVMGVQVGIHLVLSQDPMQASPAGLVHMHHASSYGPSMWLAHGAAAAAVAVWLRRGEAALWRAVRRVFAALRPPPPSTPIPHSTSAVPPCDAVNGMRDEVLAMLGNRRRGPPGHGAPGNARPDRLPDASCAMAMAPAVGAGRDLGMVSRSDGPAGRSLGVAAG